MNYKRDYSKCKIQLCYEWVFASCTDDDDPRYIYWRINPNEMTWWDRIFKNPWRRFERVLVVDINPLWDPMNFKKELSHIKTYEQALKWQGEQYDKMNEDYNVRVENGEA